MATSKFCLICWRWAPYKYLYHCCRFCHYYFFIPSSVKIPRVKVKRKTKSWSGHSSSLEKLLWSMMELKRCTVIDMRWKRKLGSRLSPEIDTLSYGPASKRKRFRNSYYYYYYYYYYYHYHPSWSILLTSAIKPMSLRKSAGANVYILHWFFIVFVVFVVESCYSSDTCSNCCSNSCSNCCRNSCSNSCCNFLLLLHIIVS